MGANNGTKVAALCGAVYWAPRGTVLPTDASTALPETFRRLGAVTDEGVKPSRDTKTDQVKEWDGSTLVNLLTEDARGYEFTLVSVFDQDVLEFVNGRENVSLTPATSSSGTKITVKDVGGKPDQGVLVFDMRFGKKKVRKVIPTADPVIDSEEAYKLDGLTGFGVNVAALKDAAGVYIYTYAEDNDVVVA